MDTRQSQLLKLVIANHIETAEPVGSKFLVAESKLEWSEATVRNELRALEEEGYLTHPHTSAGRLPTAKGYRYFVDNLDLSEARPTKKENIALEAAARSSGETETARKYIAKTTAELGRGAVLLAFSPQRVYYTGLSNLFNQPEFRETSVVVDVSAMFDRCEECLQDFFDKVDAEIKFFIGAEQPFGDYLTVATFKAADEALFSLLGPMRMDYEDIFGIMKKVKEII